MSTTLAAPAFDRIQIDRYEAGADALRRWIDGLSPADLDAVAVPGTWTIRQLVTHMLDSDLIATHRMRRMVAEKLPLLIGYDESALANNQPLYAGGLEFVADLFALHRRWTAAFLRTLPDDAFQRRGVHNERGMITVGEMVPMYAQHVTHHERFLRAKREALKKPLR